MLHRAFPQGMLLVFGGIFLSSSHNLYSQATQGTLLGGVTDSTGAAVSRAHVVVKHEGTNFERKIGTGESGDYRVSGLESGNYEVTVTAPGFKVFRQTHVDLTLGQIKRVDVRLDVGDVGTTVTVEGGTSQIETEAPTLANVKTTRDYVQLPMSAGGRPDMLTVGQVVAG